MALAWFSGQKESLADLIARKRYGKAIEVLREQFREGVRDPRMRLQLADVLVLAGRAREAAPILSALADEFAREGYAAKAIAVLKKVEKIAPGRADVERRLAELIHKKLGSAPAPAIGPAGDEIGLELGIAPISAQADLPAAPEARPEEVFEEEFFGELQGMIDEGQKQDEAGRPEGGAARPAISSPLFGGFSAEELSAVIEKLQLLSFEPGDIVVSEGEPGNSLFVLTSGVLKAFVRSRDGRNGLVREMGDEGTFFGEVSVLSGKPRSATVTCATRCELLELDRTALAEIIAAQPRVRTVIEEAFRARAGSEAERQARASGTGGAS